MKLISISSNRRPLLRFRAMLLALSLACTGCVSAVEMIVHADVKAQFLNINTARSIFGMRQAVWPDGTPVRVFVMPEHYSLHAVFCRDILNVYPYQLHQSWNRLVYSGAGQAPMEVASEQEMVEKVSQTPGAIGYVNKVISNDPVHAISLR
jgi:ABC-type phosphate transport system substrate-binding protein